MHPASFQPGSAPIEYQVQVPSSPISNTQSHDHTSPYLENSASSNDLNEANTVTAASGPGENSAGQRDARPQFSQNLIRDCAAERVSLSNEPLDSPGAASASFDIPNTIGRDTTANTVNQLSIASNATVESVIKFNSTDNDSSHATHIVGHASEQPLSPPMMSCKSTKPCPSTPPISHLMFTYFGSASRLKKKKLLARVPPPPCHKHSCAHPTLMAPYHHGKVFPVHQRHKYSHHGPSRQGMERVKAFWSRNFVQEAHRDGQSGDQLSKAQADLAALYDMDYTQVLEKPATIHPLASKQSLEGAQRMLPPIVIHPRRGDIMALRDPYCVQIDCQFVGLPTWTISKAIWMQDLHLASENQLVHPKVNSHRMHTPTAFSSAYSDQDDEEDDDSQVDNSVCTDAESDSEFDSSPFTPTMSDIDDSDATLVENDSEADLPRLGALKAGTAFYQWASKGSLPPRRPIPASSYPTSASSPLLHSTFSSDVNFDSRYPPSLSQSSSHSSISDMMVDVNIDVDVSSWSQTFYTPHTSRESLPIETYHQSCPRNAEVEDDVWSTTPPSTPTVSKQYSTPIHSKQTWQTNWYCRWEMLIDLTRKGHNRKHGSSFSCPATPGSEGVSKGQKFFFDSAQSDDEDGDCLEQTWREFRGRTISA